MPRTWFPQLLVYLERNLPPNRAAYAAAQARRPALQPYATILHAARAAADTRVDAVRDGIVGAIVAEYQAEPAGLWSAAAVVAMGPALASLAREIRVRQDRKDVPYMLLDAFYDSMRRIVVGPRIGFRLYSETRRQVFRAARVCPDDAPSTRSVVAEALSRELDPESCLDATRFLERARRMPPQPGETPLDYLERITPSQSREQRLERQKCLQSFRSTSLAALGQALSAFKPATTEKEAAQ